MKENTHILIIEDNNLLRRSLVNLLTVDKEYNVIAFGTAGEGLKFLESACPDLIILDLQLPDMSGNDFLRELPRHEYSLTPVVVISGRPWMLQPDRHVKAVLPKPFDAKELLSTLDQVLTENINSPMVMNQMNYHLAAGY